MEIRRNGRGPRFRMEQGRRKLGCELPNALRHPQSRQSQLLVNLDEVRANEEAYRLEMADLLSQCLDAIDAWRTESIERAHIELDAKFDERRRSLIRILAAGIRNIATKAVGK